MIFLEVPGKPKLLKSECNVFTILRDDRYLPPIFSATKWVGNVCKLKIPVGRFDSLEEAQKACEAAV